VLTVSFILAKRPEQMIQGLVFSCILLTGSLLLADRKLVRFRPPRTGILIFTPGRRRQRQQAEILLVILFCILCGWLILKRDNARQKSFHERSRLEKHAILVQGR
jgi:hypothetical protein